MSDPLRLASGRSPGRSGDIAVPTSRSSGPVARRARFLIGGGALLMLAALGLAGQRALAQAPDRVTVRPGDTLSAIALRQYGDAAAAARIVEANRILNPDLILAGTELVIPHE